MALSNAERQRRFIAKLRAKAASAGGASVSNGGMAVSEVVIDAAEAYGVPVGEMADFLIELGVGVFNRGIKSRFRSRGGRTELVPMSNDVAWWLIEMHSKYPDTFNVGAWEGSCGQSALDKLYAERGVPVGRYQEWAAEQATKKRPG